MTIRDMIINRMDHLGWTQAKLSSLTGISRQRLSQILTGQYGMLPRHLIIITTIMGLEVDFNQAIWPDHDYQNGEPPSDHPKRFRDWSES